MAHYISLELIFWFILEVENVLSHVILENNLSMSYISELTEWYFETQIIIKNQIDLIKLCHWKTLKKKGWLE